MIFSKKLTARTFSWPALLAGCVGGLVVAFALTLRQVQDGLGVVPLFLGLFFGILIFVGFLQLQKTARVRAFRDLHDESPHPAFLIDQAGTIIGQNTCAWRSVGAIASLEAGLTDGIENSSKLIYGLGREAKASHHAQRDVVWHDSPATLDATNISNNMQIWQILPAREAPAEVMQIVADLPRLLIDNDGQIISTNDAARRILPATAERMNDIVEDGPLRTNGTHKIAGQNGQLFRFSQFQADHDRHHVLMMPSASQNDAGQLPDHMLEDLPVSLVRMESDGTLRYINAAARTLLGPKARTGARLGELIEGLGRPIAERLKETLAGRAQGRSEVARGMREGSDVFLQLTMTRSIEGNDTTILGVLSDATELKTLEAQFVQSQKMQAVGQLAGGIAHDFNNLLTAITGHCDLLLLRHENGDTNHADLIQIRQNANRAAGLVRQLLAFSRKQTLQPHVLHLFDTIAELAHLLDRLLGEKVTLDVTNREDIWPVRVDERQLEQVVVNLVVNARDAMPSGGEVKLSTRNLELSHDLERDRATVPAGQYSVIEVRDSGMGIPVDHLPKIFEPFYTTKRVGEGTGLGLSTAYGIVKQTGGFIFVDSEINKGTTFSIYLPIHDETATEQAETGVRAVHKEAEDEGFQDLTGRGTVLLVEDEAPVRSFAARALQIRGYSVLEADSGEAALELLESNDLEVDLFVSDVVMPGMNGPSWVRKAIETRPNVSTIFMSGYAEDAFKGNNPEIPNSSFLAKPFSLTELTARVREHMDTYVVR